MFIAQQLKKENIGEYLLYMWQIEDMIRAFDLDMSEIEKHIIKPYNLPDNQRKALYEWYESLIDMMRCENVQTKGHLQLNKNIVIELSELHNELLRTGKAPAYSAKFYHILPSILQLRKQQTDMTISDIEICFSFMYGIILLKLQKREITPETTQVQAEFSKFLILLSKNYQLYKSGELEFF